MHSYKIHATIHMTTTEGVEEHKLWKEYEGWNVTEAVEKARRELTTLFQGYPVTFRFDQVIPQGKRGMRVRLP